MIAKEICMQILTISKREAGQRLDKFLSRFLNEAPQSFIYKMLRKKNIVLNDKKAGGNEKISENDEVKLFLSDETIAKFSKSLKVNESIPLDIVYEDEDVVFINKPVGILSQKAEADDVSINEYLISYLLGNNTLTMDDLKIFHPAVCNRLDRNTSGIILAGKTMRGLQGLSQRLKSRSLEKYYLCLVSGQVKQGALIKGYLRKDSKLNKVIIAKDADITNEEGAPLDSYIETAYTPLCSNGNVTLLKVELITGRTHQIRSHLASIGNAIVGDGKYGNKKVNEQFKKKYSLKYQLLHAWYICFDKKDTGEFEGLAGRRFVADLPKQFKDIIKREHLEEYNEENNFE